MGGRRALYGGYRHLLDDHFDVLVPAITRLTDAGVGTSAISGGGAGGASASAAAPTSAAGAATGIDDSSSITGEGRGIGGQPGASGALQAYGKAAVRRLW